jgi:hypothetical protein
MAGTARYGANVHAKRYQRAIEAGVEHLAQAANRRPLSIVSGKAVNLTSVKTSSAPIPVCDSCFGRARRSALMRAPPRVVRKVPIPTPVMSSSARNEANLRSWWKHFQ